MMKSFAFLLAVFIFLAPPPAPSQTNWLKYGGNPVLTRGPTGTWDNRSVFPNRVIFENSVYRMWYTGSPDGTFWRTGHATSPDGITWTKSAENPVLSEGPAPWENAGSSEGYVIATASGYKMWYTGEDFPYNLRIAYAASPDGIVWTKAASANPVLSPGPWYLRGPHLPSVLGPDSLGGYKMWFTGEPFVHADFQIGYATATDETTWTPRADPVFSYGSAGSWDDDKVFCPKVLYNGKQYEMWYAGERSDGRTQIGYATSIDGLSWTRHSSNPVLHRGPTSWDAQDFYSLDVLFDGSIYHMWYGGTDVLGTAPRGAGYAVSPKGMNAGVSPTGYVPPGDTVWVTASVDDTTGLFYFAEIESPDGTPVDSIVLNHVGSGVFTNYSIVPSGTNNYFVDLKLRLQDTLTFEMDNIGTFTTITSVSDESGIPRGYYLEQNYPNPFNPSTVIRYSLPVTSYITLKVYSLLGQQVATLVNEEMKPGSHEVTWDASGMASGVYLYRLTAANFVETKKLVLMR